MGARVLVVDDERSTLELVRYVLERASYEVFCAEDGVQGLRQVEQVLPHVIVADVMMPELDGLEMCRRIRQLPGFELVPFVFLSARGQIHEQVQGLESGADDYIAKPFEREELLARIEAALRRADAYHRVARTDALTELGNRDLFEQRLREELYREKRYGVASTLALVAIDIDELNHIEQRHGSAAKDALLRYAGRFLRDSVRALDVPTRYSESGFIVLMPHTSRDCAMVAVRRLCDRLNAGEVQVGDTALPVNASFGVAIVERDMADLADLINRAHTSMMMARRQQDDKIWVWPDEAPAGDGDGKHAQSPDR